MARATMRSSEPWSAIDVASEAERSVDARADGGAVRRAKGSVQDRVYAELKRRLLVGMFLPGEPLTLRALAGEFGVSPMPVRAAMAQLIAEGGLELLPNRAVRVQVMTTQRLSELLAVRRQLEGMATAEACLRVTDAELAALRAIHEETMHLIGQKRHHAILASNQRFHFTLYGFARSWVLMPMIEMLWLRAGPFIHLAQKSVGSKLDGRHHVEVLDALDKRDPKAARRAIERDIGQAEQSLRQSHVPL